MATNTVTNAPFYRSVEQLNQLYARPTFVPLLSQCSWHSPESTPGACDGGHPCQELARITDLDDEQGYCTHHFYNRHGVR
jgi:hypothetical protein